MDCSGPYDERAFCGTQAVANTISRNLSLSCPRALSCFLSPFLLISLFLLWLSFINENSPWQSKCMVHILKYDSEFHFMATFETTFKLPLFCHFTLVSSLWQDILFTPVLHFNTFESCL